MIAKSLFLTFSLLMVLFSNVILGQDENKIVTDGYQVFYHENGKKASEGTMREGKPDGYWKTYNEEEILISEGNRKNFELDSTWKFYDGEGKLTMEINYREGKKNGTRITYREDERIEELFVNDRKEGPTVYYYPDGKIKKELNFQDGLEEGLSKEYDTDGRIITLVTYKKGFITEREIINRYDNARRKHGYWKYFHTNGKIRMEGYYKHGKENGYFKEYDLNGNLLSTAKYAEGSKLEDVAELVKLEVRKDYYPDGKVKIAATYNKEGKLEGVRREYATDGTVEKSYIFKNGIMIGEGVVTEKGERDGYWKEYYEDGKLRAEGRYIKDLKDGAWKYYHPNGMTDQQGVYRDGKPEGDWFWYYPGGELLREEAYYNGLPDGIMTEYDESGNIITKGEYLEGLEEGDWYYRVGDNETTGAYAEGKRNGTWKYYDVPEGMGNQKVLRFEGRFIEDNPHEKHTWYWDNGNRKEEGSYVMGRKEGEWIYYNYDGLIFIVVSYKNGIEQRYDGIQIMDAKTSDE